jgi:hypothetical protein
MTYNLKLGEMGVQGVSKRTRQLLSCLIIFSQVLAKYSSYFEL